VNRWGRAVLADIDALFNKHKLIRRSSFILAWVVLWKITDSLIFKSDTMSAHVAGALRDIAIAVFAVIGFYHYSRGKDQ